MAPLQSESPERKAPEEAIPGVAWSASQPEADRPAIDPEAPVREDEKLRDATTRVFRGENGILTVDAYPSPIHYETADGWVPIDNQPRPDAKRPGWFTTSGNRWSVGFGPSAEGVELLTGAGVVSMVPTRSATAKEEASVGPTVESDDAAKEPAPKTQSELVAAGALPDSGRVVYEDVWPGVDVRYVVDGSGVKEEIVLDSAAGGSEFSFDVRGTTLTPQPDGGMSLGGDLGKEFRVPPPLVRAADGAVVTAGSGARYTIEPGAEKGSTALTVSVDPEWLAKQGKASFPLVIDPTFTLVNPLSGLSYSSLGSGYVGPPISFGRYSPDTSIWRGTLRFNQYEPYLTGGYRVYNAMLQFSGHGDAAPPIQVFDQGAQPMSYAAIGNGKPLVDGPWDGPFVTVTKVMDRWVTAGLANQWFGVRGVESGNTLVTHDVRLVLEVYKPPQASLVTNIANQQVLSTTTPLLQSQAVPFGPNGSDPGIHPWHQFQITTSPAPGTGLVLASGMIEQTSASAGVSWSVPQGTLQEGVSYWGWVLTDYPQYGGPPAPTVPPLANGRRFTVDLGLGEGGPSPTDEVGSVPGDAVSPAEASPGPGLPGSKVTTNLVDGNLSTTVGTKTMGTLSGPLALAFTYNSLMVGNRGLRAEFFNDTNASGVIDVGDAAVADRVDPTVSFDFGSGILAKAAASQDPTKALGRWTGFLTVPTTGTWQVGAISSDGLRATIGGTLRLDRWTTHEPEAAAVFGSSFSATSTAPVPIQVEWRNTSGRGVARVFLRNVTNPSTPLTYELSPAWLSRTPASLPHGWTLNAAAGSAQWVGLADRGTSVSMFAADGSAHEFVGHGNGAYTPPVTAPGDLLTLGDGGRFVLRDSGGQTYTFRPDGTLESLVTAGDDRNPAALQYGYSGSPARLRTIADPVSARSVTLRYGGDTECAGAPAAAAGLLCRIEFWDATTTTLTYDTAGRFIRLTNPGAIVHDFAYDAAGRLTDIRDPLANAAIAAGVRADNIEARTQIGYYADGKVFIIVTPAPTAGAAQAQRVYGYDPVARTGSVHVAGFTPTVGFAQRVRYDTRNRIIEQTGSDGLSSTYTWDALDRPLSSTDTAGLRTTSAYDYASRNVASYGPAPAASFQANGLPLAGATVPTTTRTFDQGMAGLAAAYWTNPYAAGTPALHDTGLGTGGALDRDWASTPPVTPGLGGWSTRLSGWLTVPTATSYEFQTNSKGSAARVWVDDALVVDQTGAEPASGWATTTGAPTALTAGAHRIRVDYIDTTGPAGLQVLSRPSGGSFTVVAGTALTPGYGLVTSTTDPDNMTSATEYSDPAAGIGPHYGLPTATISDPAGLGLRTSITYETPGAGSFLRRVARTLPGGNTWTTTNYTGTGGPIDTQCGVSTGTPQGGLPRRITGPDPDGAGPAEARVEEFIYDPIGRRVGRRVGTTASIAGAGWSCATYDAQGRMVTETWPAHDSDAARTTTHTYAVGSNPLVNTVSDSTWGSSAISTTVDLLGRPVSYTDIWGSTTTSVYDLPGRRTSTTGPLGFIAQNYDAATGRATTTVANGSTIATPTYETATGRLSSVAYYNSASAMNYGYDTYGRVNGIGVYDAAGTTGDLVTRSLAGRVIDQQVFNGTAFIDASPGQPNYLYDSAGRLTEARLPGVTSTYGFGTAAGCTAPGAGANTNRTSLTTTGTGGGTTNSCYDNADRLVSTSTIGAGSISYDDHGNTLTLGTETFDYDSADRHTRTESPGGATTFRRDPLDRVVERSDLAAPQHVATTTATGTGTSVTVARPAGTATGDLMVASVSASALVSPGAITAAGWSVVTSRTNLTGKAFVLWRYATAADPANWTFTVASSSNVTAALSTYRTTAPTVPVAVSSTRSSTLATSHPLPQVTTTGDYQHLVQVAAFPTNVIATGPASTTQRASVSSAASLLVVDRLQTRAGTNPASSATSTLVTSSAAITVALKPVTTVARPGFSGATDSSDFGKNPAGTLTDFAIGLPGNTTYQLSNGVYEFVHANIHGDVITVDNLAGARVWTGVTGPYGEPVLAAAPPTGTTPGSTLRWHGLDQRVTDRGIVQMGARAYSTTHGRFLTVDPIEGGCANNYAYVNGDPVNASDVSGKSWWDPTDWGDEIGGFLQDIFCPITGREGRNPLGTGLGAGGLLLSAGGTFGSAGVTGIVAGTSVGGAVGVAAVATGTVLVVGGVILIVGGFTILLSGGAKGCAERDK